MCDERTLFAARNEPDARAELSSRYEQLAVRLALRFKGRGQPVDDLTQVARVGLLNAIDRFDVDRGVAFATFATRTIVGELKRHLRDKGWAVRVPRALQERSLEVNRTVQDLTQRLGRSPTLREIAQHMGVSIEDVIEGLEAGGAYAAASIDAAPSSDDDSWSLVDMLGDDDAVLDRSADRVAVADLVARLPERERVILQHRFYDGMTQSEIAEELGISQMHVSRLLRSTIRKLRQGLDEA